MGSSELIPRQTVASRRRSMTRRLAIISALAVLFMAWSFVGFMSLALSGTHACALLQTGVPRATPWSEASLTPEQWAQITHHRCDRPLTGQFLFIGAGYVVLGAFAVRSLRPFE